MGENHLEARLDLRMERWLKAATLSLFAHEQPAVPVSQARHARALQSILCPKERETEAQGTVSVWWGGGGEDKSCVLDS